MVVEVPTNAEFTALAKQVGAVVLKVEEIEKKIDAASMPQNVKDALKVLLDYVNEQIGE